VLTLSIRDCGTQQFGIRGFSTDVPQNVKAVEDGLRTSDVRNKVGDDYASDNKSYQVF
jgi:hypothetical protein